jgi:uncharacterized phage-associated protein
MTPRFDEKKATQIAGLLLKLRQQGGRMSYMKLIKLMYLIDRAALLRWGWSMTGDNYVSMEHGQVLSETYNLIKHHYLGRPYWRTFISERFGDSEVRLVKESETDELSRADKDLIEEVFREFGRWDRWKLAKYTHDLPEYQETLSSIPVGYDDVLRVEGVPEERIVDILDELSGLAQLERLAS